MKYYELRRKLDEYLEKNDDDKFSTHFTYSNLKSLSMFFVNELNQEYFRMFLRDLFINERFNWELMYRDLIDKAHNVIDLKYDSKDEKDFSKVLLLIIKCVLVSIYNKHKGNENIKYDVDDFPETPAFSKERKLYIYRGQSDHDWKLVPTMLRNLDDNVEVNINYLEKRYSQLQLKNKYDSIWPSKKIIDYDFISFMQHACSYSPLIDFTKSHIVGMTFALSNQNIFNDFYSKDGGYHIVEVDEAQVLNTKEDIDRFLQNDFKIINISSSKIYLGSKIQYESNGKKEELEIISISRLINLLTPKYKILDLYTNDRMKYQQGMFVVFYDCICIKGKIMYEFNHTFNHKKLSISKTRKKTLLDLIYSTYPYYTLSHLMEPYIYFNE